MGARSKIRQEGDVFQIHIPQLPCRILSIKKARFGNLLHTNRKFRRHFTNVGAGIMYRFPLPGRGGATLNQASVKRALQPHCRVYHNTDAVRYAFSIDAKRGREVFLYPPMSPPSAQRAVGGGGSPEAPGRETLQSSRSDARASSPRSNASPKKSPRKSSSRRVIEVESQDTQDPTSEAVQKLACSPEQSSKASREELSASPLKQTITEQPQLEEVHGGHRGTGVHIMDFSSMHAPCARELATPTSHYANRQRGPEVIAEGVILGDSYHAVAPRQRGAGDLQAWASPSDPTVTPESNPMLEPEPERSTLDGGFVSGGFLLTVTDANPTEN